MADLDASSESPEPPGFYLQILIGTLCGSALGGCGWATALFFPNAGWKLWILIFVAAWIGIFRLVRAQLHGIILGFLIGAAIIYVVIGILFHFPEFGGR